MDPTRPSLDLLRRLSDRHVVGALVDEPRLTRAQVAQRTGLSKPTVGESMRRLTEAGIVRDTGERTSGPGRAGTLFALADDLGVALAVDIAPHGVTAEAVDVRGHVVASSTATVLTTTTPDAVEQALVEVAGAVTGGTPAHLAVVSAADPVDRETGRLVHLPDAPFLVGELSPVDLLSHVVAGPVVVDNDVNWAARAEHDADPGLTETAYLYLDQGLGCALVSDGRVLRGAGGLAGEVAHVVTTGPDGRALPFTDLFAALGLRRPGTTAVDVESVLDVLAAGGRERDILVDGVRGVVSAIVALADPEVVLVGGSWGGTPGFVAALGERVAALPRPVAVRAATVAGRPALAGARREALRRLREHVLTASHPV